MNKSTFPFLLIILFSIISCSDKLPTKEEVIANKVQSEKDFVETMQKHLDAVSNKDLVSLKSTMSPAGKMQLILPGTEIINDVAGFMNYHQEWFKDTNWTFETKILNTEIGNRVGMAITEVVYSEPERDGVPYFNRMIVSYSLEKLGNEWYIIKDHASSVEKSTDKK